MVDEFLFLFKKRTYSQMRFWVVVDNEGERPRSSFGSMRSLTTAKKKPPWVAVSSTV